MVNQNIMVGYICHESNIDKVVLLAKDIFLGKPYTLINIEDLTDMRERINFINKSMLVILDNPNHLDHIINHVYNNIMVLDNLSFSKSKEDIQHEKQYTKIDPKNIYYIDTNNGIAYPKIRLEFLKNNNFLDKIDDDVPFVSCVCPTYNRHNFLPILCELFNNQDYPKELCELIILDDSVDAFSSINKYNINSNIRYYHMEADKLLSPILDQSSQLYTQYVRGELRVPIGKKRNLLHQLARGKYIVCFDDDDYYPPTRISQCINVLESSKKKKKKKKNLV
eukprot:gnl/Spiro4/15458_TR8317_c0_g1_i1.p1 gnl/Spiro4/15458_TR8317_c0_g1~~gnl/Spiro4/15458_TR8317_c0_g1_i1.p1  ORF type:complete len:280 (+),score=-52.65 gnl/Spiro4/15458_TR8317_c0_g1_i1:1174-2013(+)